MAKLLRTVLCEQLGIRWPVVLAPMAAVSGGQLAAAISRGGGLGLIGAGYADADWIHQEFERAQPEVPGIGFITWYLHQHPEQLDAALGHQPAAIMLSFGDAEPFAARIKASGIPLMMQVQTLASARDAASLGADIIVAQGADGGGHGGQRGTFALVPAVSDAVSPIPVIAAGGIADGRGIAAALMLGARGVLIGTRFYASCEALGQLAVKEALRQSGGDETIRTRVFDIAREIDWPAPFTGRALVNDFTQRWHGREGALARVLETIGPTYKEAARIGDVDTAVVWASEVVDLISSIEPAEVLLHRMVREAEQRLGASEPC